MLKLFEPKTKVQKDRQLIQETDRRMAKYSRRGIISNFLIYSLTLAFERTLMHDHPTWVMVMTAGLLIVTAWRGYLLFRIDTIYPRGPTAWRNHYFAATLLGACCWGLILASFTLLLDLKAEAALLWLYTVVFFATTAHAFAPFQRFLSIYQFVGIVPAAICCFFIGEPIGIFYGAILLFFYWVLKHHCELMSLNYWDRLEAQYSLARKTESLELEKRDTRASVVLSNEYVQVLAKRLHLLLDSSLHSEDPPSARLKTQITAIEGMCRNVDDFQRILNRDLIIEQRIFNARHYLQNIVAELIDEAEINGVELETALSPALPARLIGDSIRIGQVLRAAVQTVVRQHKDGVALVEIEFTRSYEHSGELHFTIAQQAAQVKKTFFQTDVNLAIDVDLDLVLAKGIAEVLGGSLEVDELGAKDGKNVRFNAPLNVAEVNAITGYRRLGYKGRPLMLVHHNPRWLDHKRLELTAMGFDVHTTNRFKRCAEELADAVKAGKPFELVVYYVIPDDESSVEFCNELSSNGELKNIHQFVVCSERGQEFFSQRLVSPSPLVRFVRQPAGFFEFDIAFSEVFDRLPLSLSGDANSLSPTQRPKILWVDYDENLASASLYDGCALDVDRVSDAKQIVKALESGNYDMALVEFNAGSNFEAIFSIREFELSHQREAFIPIIGLAPRQFENEMLAAGVDHVIDMASMIAGDTKMLCYWAQHGPL